MPNVVEIARKYLISILDAVSVAPEGNLFCTRYSESPNRTSRNDVRLGGPSSPGILGIANPGELAEQTAQASVMPASIARIIVSARGDGICQLSLATAEADSTTRSPPDSTALSRIATRSAPER